jgi:holo-[acyl-carrier protein] synthase
MKQAHIGVDIIEISRIRQSLDRWGERFLQRVFTNPEIELYRGKTESLAARFAGKEASMKALNVPDSGLSWKDIEILSGPNGQPVVNLYGSAREEAVKLGLSGLEISLSHSREYAIALVIGVREV